MCDCDSDCVHQGSRLTVNARQRQRSSSNPPCCGVVAMAVAHLPTTGSHVTTLSSSTRQPLVQSVHCRRDLVQDLEYRRGFPSIIRRAAACLPTRTTSTPCRRPSPSETPSTTTRTSPTRASPDPRTSLSLTRSLIYPRPARHGRRNNRSGRPGGCRTDNLTNKNFYVHNTFVSVT